jgi:hypothetical protein
MRQISRSSTRYYALHAGYQEYIDAGFLDTAFDHAKKRLRANADL